MIYLKDSIGQRTLIINSINELISTGKYIPFDINHEALMLLGFNNKVYSGNRSEYFLYDLDITCFQVELGWRLIYYGAMLNRYFKYIHEIQLAIYSLTEEYILLEDDKKYINNNL